MTVPAPAPQNHPAQGKPARESGESTPVAALPAVAGAAASAGVQPTLADAQTSLPAPRMDAERANREELPAEPAGDPAAVLQDTPGDRPSTAPALIPAPGSRVAAPAQSQGQSRPATESPVPANPKPVHDAASLATDPEPPGGQPAPASAAPGTGEAGRVARGASGPPIETRLSQPAVRFMPPEAPQSSQETAAIAAAPQTGPEPPSDAPGSVTKTAGGRIAAPSARGPQPARLFANHDGADKAAATAVPWVPPWSATAPEAPPNRIASSQDSMPAAGPAAQPAILENPSGGRATASQSGSAVSNPAAPAPAKTAARRARAQEVPVSREARPGQAVEAPDSAGAAKPGEADKQDAPRPTVGPAPGPLSSGTTPAPSPVSLAAAPAADPAPVSSVAETTAESRGRTSPAHTATAGSTPEVSTGLEAVVMASLAEDAASGVSGDRLPAGRIAFEALLTPEPPAASGSAGASAGGIAAARARIEVPAAGTAPRPETSEDLVSPVPVSPVRVSPEEVAPPAGDGGEPLAGQRPRPASDAGRTGAAVRSDAGRKPATASATASFASAADAPPATSASGTAVGGTASGPQRPGTTAAPAAETAVQAADARPAPDPPKPSAAAHDMRFAVGGGDQRVEVRVAERGGEVHVAVRTPDQRLAGSLRDDLPSLTAKLESAGLRAETWQGDFSGGAGRQRQGETSSPALSQNSQQQPGRDGRRQQDDPPPQRPRRSEDSSQPKPDRKDFQWLFTSLQ